MFDAKFEQLSADMTKIKTENIELREKEKEYRSRLREADSYHKSLVEVKKEEAYFKPPFIETPLTGLGSLTSREVTKPSSPLKRREPSKPSFYA